MWHPAAAVAQATRVVEIGCGLGGAGIGVALGLAARLCDGASFEVVITDGSLDVVEAARANVQAVLLSEAASALRAAVAAGAAAVSCEQLLWGMVNHDEFLARHVDAFDLVIGCDIIYSHEQLPMLMATVHALLRRRKEVLSAAASATHATSEPLCVIAFRDRSRLSPVHPKLEDVLMAAFKSRKGGLQADVLDGDYSGSEAMYEGCAGPVQVIRIWLGGGT